MYLNRNYGGIELSVNFDLDGLIHSIDLINEDSDESINLFEYLPALIIEQLQDEVNSEIDLKLEDGYF